MALQITGDTAEHNPLALLQLEVDEEDNVAPTWSAI